MKKGICLIGLFALTILLTGCGNTITCKGTTTEDGLNIKTSVVATVGKKDEIESAKANLEFEDETQAKDFCSLVDQINNMAVNEEDKIKVSCESKKITFDNYLKMLGSDSYTKDEFLEKMADIKLECQ